MNTLVRLITATVVAILMTSCNFDVNFGPGVSGDGNVVTKQRKISGDFDAIKVSRGIEVELSQDNNFSLEVEADENLHDIITTEVEGNVLRISSDENIKTASAKKVIISIGDISRISTTSGANVYSDTSFELSDLRIESTSGSHVNMDVYTDVLKVSSTSGAGIKLKGTATELTVSSTSGSYVRANELKAENTEVSATSGASISVNTTKALTASATSGANIKYSGNPEKVEKNKAVSGSIREE